ncbi:MAG: flagellar hook-basal body protein [Opitutaceae bacterium]
MIQGIYQSAAAADGLQAWNDAIARNIASSSTPGFKGTHVSFEGVLAGSLVPGGQTSALSEQSRLAPEARPVISFAPGEMRHSGDPHEFAIEGEGFFRLQQPDGGFVYTRDGQFRVSGDGRLVSKQGYEVTSDAGPIQLLIDGGPLTIDPEGRLRQGDQDAGLLSVFTFQSQETLLPTNGGFMIDPAKLQEPALAEESRVRQGFLEMGNVSGIREMTNLILVSNALQANHKVIQNFDSLTERAVQVLGSTSS